jgi:hypothetical protein
MDAETATTSATRFLDRDGQRWAYRRLNEGAGVPLLLTQHVMGNLDTIDPAVLDGLARDRDAIWFDTVGIGASSGEPRSSIRGDGGRRCNSRSAARPTFAVIVFLGHRVPHRVVILSLEPVGRAILLVGPVRVVGSVALVPTVLVRTVVVLDVG